MSGDGHSLGEQAGRRRLQSVHGPLIVRLKKGDAHAIHEAREIVGREVASLRTEAEKVDPMAADPNRLYLSLQQVRGKAYDAAQLARVLLMETREGSR